MKRQKRPGSANLLRKSLSEAKARVKERETINRSNRAIMDAIHSEATTLEAWAKANDVTVATMTDGWIAFDSDVRRGVCGKTITDAVRALRAKMENVKREMGGAR